MNCFLKVLPMFHLLLSDNVASSCLLIGSGLEIGRLSSTDLEQKLSSICPYISVLIVVSILLI